MKSARWEFVIVLLICTVSNLLIAGLYAILHREYEVGNEFGLGHPQNGFLRKNLIFDEERREFFCKKIDAGLEVSKPVGISQLLRLQLFGIRIDTGEDVEHFAVRHILKQIDDEFIFQNVALCGCLQFAKGLPSKGFMMRFADLEAILEKL